MRGQCLFHRPAAKADGRRRGGAGRLADRRHVERARRAWPAARWRTRRGLAVGGAGTDIAAEAGEVSIVARGPQLAAIAERGVTLQSDGRAFYYADYNRAGQKVYSNHRFPCCSGTLPQVALTESSTSPRGMKLAN